MTCLGPESDPRMSVIDAYDQGRGGDIREAGTLPPRGDGMRDALLLAPDPVGYFAKTDDDWLAAYLDWWRDVRGVALERSKPQPSTADTSAELLSVLRLAVEHMRRTSGMGEVPGWVDVAERTIAAAQVRQ